MPLQREKDLVNRATRSLKLPPGGDIHRFYSHVIAHAWLYRQAGNAVLLCAGRRKELECSWSALMTTPDTTPALWEVTARERLGCVNPPNTRV